MSERLLRLWPRLEPILDQLEEVSENERMKRAEQLCDGDLELASALHEYLAAEASSDELLTARPLIPILDEPPTSFERLDHYRILDLLGRGGMSVVFRAARDDGEFSHVVAIKLLDTGVVSEAAVERFRRERETLARLHHPNIAQLYDGGVTGSGAPYLVMELIEGQRIDEYVTQRALDLNTRLKLFLQVCGAIEYAHSRLVIHRDIKPGNLLVDEHGAVKLLDFGISKLIDEQSAASDSSATSTRSLTPGYAAPEQFRGEAATVATDVYQLGTVLYELLCGRRAHGSVTSSWEELREASLSHDSPPPSASATGEAKRRLAGDLDAIVAQAMRKEPAERYRSVEALRRDVENFLAELPVEARRGNRLYRARKSMRRHRTLFTAASVATGSLLLGLVGVLAQARVVASERDRARDAESRVSAINEFLVNELLQGPTPEKSLGKELTVREVLDNASHAVGPALGDTPSTEAEVRLALARSYLALGDYEEASQHADTAQQRFEQLGGDGRAGALRARTVSIELALLRARIEPAQQQSESLVADCVAELGPQHPDTIAAQLIAARVLHALGRPAQAAEQIQLLLSSKTALQPDRWRLRVDLLKALAQTRTEQYRANEAEVASLEAVGILDRQVGPDHPEAIDALRRLALARSALLRWDDALEMHRTVLARRQRTAGSEHPDTADAWHDLAVLLSHMGRKDEAIDAEQHAAEIYKQALGSDHLHTVRALRNLAVLASQSGEYESAEQIYRRVIDARERTLGTTHPSSIQAWRDLQITLVRAGRVDAAIETARRITAAYELATRDPESDPQLVNAFAEFLLDVEPVRLRDPGRAQLIAERAVSTTQRSQPLLLATCSRALARIGDFPRAIAVAREALALPEAIRSWTTEQLLVDLLREHGTTAELEQFLLARLEQHRRLRSEDDPWSAKTMRHLAQLYQRSGRIIEAEQRFRESLAQLRKSRDENYWEIARAKSELGGLLLDLGRREEAEPLLLESAAVINADPSIHAALRNEVAERMRRLR